jgi:hypothetical protein
LGKIFNTDLCLGRFDSKKYIDMAHDQEGVVLTRSSGLSRSSSLEKNIPSWITIGNPVQAGDLEHPVK